MSKKINLEIENMKRQLDNIFKVAAAINADRLKQLEEIEKLTLENTELKAGLKNLVISFIQAEKTPVQLKFYKEAQMLFEKYYK